MIDKCNQGISFIYKMNILFFVPPYIPTTYNISLMSYPRHPISCWCRHNFLLSNKYAAMQMRGILSAIYFFESFARISLHSRVLQTYAGLLLVFFLINHLQTKIWHDVTIMINRHLMWKKSFQRCCGYTNVWGKEIMGNAVKYFLKAIRLFCHEQETYYIHLVHISSIQQLQI